MTRQHLAAAALFVALTLAMTWPLAPNLNRAVSDPGDPFINIWILDWDHWATFHQPLSLFHANIFHPAKYTLALSENLYGVALMLMPLRIAGVPPIAAYNVAMIAGIALCGFGAYLLGHRLTGSFAAGLAGGVFYAFVPFRWVHIPHVQHAWGGWLPLMLWALLVYVERPTRRNAAIFAALFVMNGLTNIHYLFFGSFAIAATVALIAWTGFREWKPLFVATAIGALILLPFLYPYLAVAKLYGFERGAAEVQQYSAIPSDWLRSGPQVRLYASLLDTRVGPERWLFPGALGIALAAIGLVFAWRERGKLALAVLWIAIGFCGSLGLNFEFHSFLFGAVPGFRSIRAPARWAVIAYIGMAVLVALTTAALARRNRWIALVVPVLFALELRAAPYRWYLTKPEPPAFARWMRTQRGAFAELPMANGAIDYFTMLWSTAHHRPIVNGASGFTPPDTARLSWLASLDPIPDEYLDHLRRLGVGHVVIHTDFLGHQSAATRDWVRREVARGRLGFVRRFDGGVGGDWVFQVGARGPMTDQLQRFLRNQPTRSESTFGSLDFPFNDAVFHHGEATFSGYALSPHGIAKVDLLFNNGRLRFPTELRPEPSLHEVYPWYPNVPRPRFVAKFDARPPGVWEHTDVEVEITDGRGAKTRLWSLFLTWRGQV
jgi:hypothetical protein